MKNRIRRFPANPVFLMKIRIVSVFEIFFDVEARTALHLTVDFSDISAERSDAEQLNSAEQPDGGDDCGPTGNRIVRQVGNQRIK